MPGLGENGKEIAARLHILWKNITCCPMLRYHLVNGDALAGLLIQHGIGGELIVCRECFMEGGLRAETEEAFWQLRAQHAAEAHGAAQADYFREVVAELAKLREIPPGSELCLWFGDELFCQANLWFALAQLAQRPALRLLRVFPPSCDAWDSCRGFAHAAQEDWEKAWAARQPLGPEDLRLGEALWDAFRSADFERLRALARQAGSCFRHLSEVCEAHIERFPAPGRPGRAVAALLSAGISDFPALFAAFSAREGIYGFGDAQLRPLYEQMRKER